jgi:PAS domain S-box-containing protein
VTSFFTSLFSALTRRWTRTPPPVGRNDDDQQLASIADIAPAIVWITAADKSCTYVNEQWLRFSGRTREEELGFGWLSEMHPDDVARCMPVFEAAFEARQPVEIEYRQRRHDGVYRSMLSRGVPRFDRNGNFSGYIGVVLDINDMRSTERELHRERERLLGIVSNVPGVVWEAWGQPDQSTQRINFISEHVTRMLGYTVEEWLSTPNFWLTIVHPDDRDAAAKRAHEHFLAGGPSTNTFRWMTKDGRAIWVESHSTVVQDEGGAPIGMRGVTLDISARKRAEESLRFASKASEALASSLDYEKTLQTIVTLAVPSLADACTITLLDEQGEARDVAAAGSLTSASDELVVAIDTLDRKLGTIRFASATPSRYDEHDRELASLLARRVSMAIDNAQLYRTAVAASAAKDDFLATVSHELRTPMTATLGWVRLLMLGQVDADTSTSALQAIESATQAQSKLIDDILDVSSIVVGKFRLDTAPVDLRHVVDVASDALRPALAAKAITLAFDASRWSGTVEGDANRLQQVVWNLLANAAKFGRSGGRIDVIVEREDNVARVIVRDDGEGIEPEFLPHVFDRFRQGESGSTRSYSGLGLGLAIVQHLVELHGGTVSAASDGRGKGATFVIELPVIELAGAGLPVAELPVAEKPKSVFPDLRRKQVLVVDREEATLDVITDLLQQCGARVTAARSAAEAILALHVHYDLVITDVGMAVADGVTLAQQLRQANGGLPAIVLRKPIDPIELATEIALVLNR